MDAELEYPLLESFQDSDPSLNRYLSLPAYLFFLCYLFAYISPVVYQECVFKYI